MLLNLCTEFTGIGHPCRKCISALFFDSPLMNVGNRSNLEDLPFAAQELETGEPQQCRLSTLQALPHQHFIRIFVNPGLSG